MMILISKDHHALFDAPRWIAYGGSGEKGMSGCVFVNKRDARRPVKAERDAGVVIALPLPAELRKLGAAMVLGIPARKNGGTPCYSSWFVVDVTPTSLTLEEAASWPDAVANVGAADAARLTAEMRQASAANAAERDARAAMTADDFDFADVGPREAAATPLDLAKMPRAALESLFHQLMGMLSAPEVTP